MMESVYVDITLSVCLCGSLFLFFAGTIFFFSALGFPPRAYAHEDLGRKPKSNHPRGHPCCRLLAASWSSIVYAVNRASRGKRCPATQKTRWSAAASTFFGSNCTSPSNWHGLRRPRCWPGGRRCGRPLARRAYAGLRNRVGGGAEADGGGGGGGGGGEADTHLLPGRGEE